MRTINRRRVLARAVAGSADGLVLWRAARRAYGGAGNLVSAIIKERLAGVVAGRPEMSQILGPSRFKKLMSVRDRTAVSNLKLFQNLDEITAEFTRHSIRHMAVKGCDLVGVLYDDPGDRVISDIDILVHPEDFHRAVAVAVENGYKDIEYRFRLPGIWPTRSMYKEKEGFLVQLDLHYCPGPELGRRRLETCRFFRGREPGTRPTDEQRFLFAVIHHQNHFFAMPLAAYHEVLLLAERTDAASFARLARPWDARLAAAVVLGQAAYLFGGPGPLDGWRRSVIGLLVRKGLDEYAGGCTWASAVTFAVSTDRPAAAIKCGLGTLKKTIFDGKREQIMKNT